MEPETWTCSVCKEKVPDNFEACWNCGATRAGEKAADFEREPPDPSVPGRGAESDDAFDGSAAGGASRSSEGRLTRADIAELACRVLALWVIAQATLSLSALLLVAFTAMLGEDGGGRLPTALATGLLPVGELIVGILLWKGSRAFAERMVRDNRSPIIGTQLDTEALMVVGFAVVGIYAVWANVHDLLQMAVQVIYLSREQGIEYASFWGNARWQADFWSTLGSLAFGLWLVFGSRGLARAVRRIRGVDQPSNEPSGETRDRLGQQG